MKNITGMEDAMSLRDATAYKSVNQTELWTGLHLAYVTPIKDKPWCHYKVEVLILTSVLPSVLPLQTPNQRYHKQVIMEPGFNTLQ